MKTLHALAVSVALVLASTPSAWAGPPPGDQPLAHLDAGAGALVWQPRQQVAGWTLRITTPGGTTVELVSAGAPVVTFQDLRTALGEVPDGAYTYEVSATLELDPATRAALDRARETGDPKPTAVLEAARTLRQSGGFRVTEGRFVYDEEAVERSDREPGATDAPSGTDALRTAAAPVGAVDREIYETRSPFGFPNGNGIKDSLCLGADCSTVEDYGQETLRMKESNLRIRFQDTTLATDPFPTRDWEILANDTAQGGLDRFSIHDVTAANVPLTVEGTAPDASVYVNAQGRVGLGTATPLEHLHVLDGDGPALRLEQDTTQSLTARTWTVRGDETALTVSDVTGATTPLAVEAGALTNALVVDASGNVGIATADPTESLHVTGSDGDTTVLVEETSATDAARALLSLKNHGAARIHLVDHQNTLADTTDDEVWYIQAGGDSHEMRFALEGSGSPEVYIRERNDAAGLPTLSVSGTASAQMLEARGSNGATALVVEETSTTLGNRALAVLTNHGPSVIRMVNTVGDTWSFGNQDPGFYINRNGTGVNELSLGRNGNLTIMGTLTENSNRETKTAIKAVDSSLVLDRVLELPLATWQRKGEDGVTHLGPMAQDFRALFGLGVSDTSISTIDVAGVALAAIQGQHDDIEDLRRRNESLADENAALRARVDALETLEERLAALEARETDR